MKHIKKIATYAAVGGFGAIIMAGLAGCGSDDGGNENALNEVAQKNGVYKILEEYPSTETRVVLKDMNGTERVLSKDEIDKLLAQANAKIDNNTSNLTRTSDTQLSSGGLSLGETILASAAGAILGSWIGSKLFGNQNFQANRQSTYKNPSAYTRSVDSFNKQKAANSAARSSGGKSGFFGGGSKSGSSSSSFGG